MRLLGRELRSPLALVSAALPAPLLAFAVLAHTVGTPTSSADAPAHHQRVAHPPAPAAPPGSTWSGYAFDACRAPSRRVMDDWRTRSPFTGVGVYLGGVARACPQPNLTPSWVRHTGRTGWQLLPIWVGPQASCTGYHHRIDGRPGNHRRYAAARRAGVQQARGAARAARRLGIARGTVLFYDIEPFSTSRTRCRRSSLAFLEAWTDELHRSGWRSGVYSHVAAAISLISRTGRGYARPDAVWYAWIDRVGTMPHTYVADTAFMRTSRVHQYALDRRVTFGGASMRIDWDFVSLGATERPAGTGTCGQVADRVHPRRTATGAHGAMVRLIQCLVTGRHPLKTSGRYDVTTQRSVSRFQRRHRLHPSGLTDRATWTALLSRGPVPVLRKGAHGAAVRRVQRSLDVALTDRSVSVDGSFGKATARAVRRYRHHLGLSKRPVVTRRVWTALAHGRVVGPPGK